jgi:hypothetical protein
VLADGFEMADPALQVLRYSMGIAEPPLERAVFENGCGPHHFIELVINFC